MQFTTIDLETDLWRHPEDLGNYYIARIGGISIINWYRYDVGMIRRWKLSWSMDFVNAFARHKLLSSKGYFICIIQSNIRGDLMWMTEGDGGSNPLPGTDCTAVRGFSIQCRVSLAWNSYDYFIL